MSAETHSSMSLERTLLLVRRRGPIVLICLLLATGSAFAFVKQQSKQYTATASILFKNNQQSAQLAGLQQNYQPPTQSSQDTNVKLVGLGDLADKTAKQLGPGWDAAAVRSAINISAVSDTSIVQVAGTAATPAEAAKLANAYSAGFVGEQQRNDKARISAAMNLVTQQYKALNAKQQAGPQGVGLANRLQSLQILSKLQTGVSLAGAATPPTSPSSPKVAREVALGAVLGLLLGLAIAFILERLDQSVRDPRDIEELYELPVLAAIPKRKAYDVVRSLGHGKRPARADVYDEVFNLLYSYLRSLSPDTALRTLLVISPGPGEGKTTISYNLAKAAAVLGSRVLVIEADLRNPSPIAPLLDRTEPSLSDVLIGEATMDEAVHSLPVVPNGTFDALIAAEMPPPNVAELIKGEAMESLLEQATASYDLVVIDTPPLGLLADAIPLLTKVDGAIVISRVGKSRRDAIEQLRKKLASLAAPVLGVVANGVRDNETTAYRRRHRTRFGDAYSGRIDPSRITMNADGRAGERRRGVTRREP